MGRWKEQRGSSEKQGEEERDKKGKLLISTLIQKVQLQWLIGPALNNMTEDQWGAEGEGLFEHRGAASWMRVRNQGSWITADAQMKAPLPRGYTKLCSLIKHS